MRACSSGRGMYILFSNLLAVIRYILATQYEVLPSDNSSVQVPRNVSGAQNQDPLVFMIDTYKQSQYPIGLQLQTHTLHLDKELCFDSSGGFAL